jgi:serine protease AprX
MVVNDSGREGGREKRRARSRRYERGNAIRDPHSVLIRSRLAPDLLEKLAQANRTARATVLRSSRPARFEVIVEMNETFPGGAKAAREIIFLLFQGEREGGLRRLLHEVSGAAAGVAREASLSDDGSSFHGEVFEAKSRMTATYAFMTLDQETIERLVDLRLELNEGETDGSKSIALIHRIWLDHSLETFVYKSAQTIKADAALSAFDCKGHGIVWAVADTGVDAEHPHFQTHGTLRLPAGIRHRDFTILNASASNLDEAEASAMTDQAGHGSHVAGIIAGETSVRSDAPSSIPPELSPQSIVVERDERLSSTQVASNDITVNRIRGVAPLCKILSLKVLDARRRGNVSDLLAAIGYIQEVNDHGRRIRIHGLNLSVGYPFDPQWFAPGHSALCVEVNRLVKSGVIVVAAAGNGGYGRVTTYTARAEQSAFLCSIADPGNAELAITVGSTHREMPHTYGVSFFSGKGPTADGRSKPDLVAPGERIVSCAAGKGGSAVFKEDSGTSMAAPHVSGAIAAFLSVRNEFVGQPERVKEIFMDAATDLKRAVEFQGRGAIDLMRALQSV